MAGRLPEPLLKLLQTLVNSLPGAHRSEAQASLDELTHRNRVVRTKKNPKVTQHWAHFRRRQMFTVMPRGGESYYVMGIDFLARLTKLRVKTVRQKLANGKGQFVLLLDEQPVTIHRLRPGEPLDPLLRVVSEPGATAPAGLVGGADAAEN